MEAAETLMAWIEPADDGRFVGAFVGQLARSVRQPATQKFDTAEQALSWVEDQSRLLGLSVSWGSAGD